MKRHRLDLMKAIELRKTIVFEIQDVSLVAFIMIDIDHMKFEADKE